MSYTSQLTGAVRLLDRTGLTTGAKVIGNNTIAVWFNVTALTANHEMIEINDSGTGGFASAIEYDTGLPGLVFLQRDGAGAGPSFSVAITANVWTHAALTWDGTNLRAYINGVQVSSATGSAVTRGNWGGLQVGPGNGQLQDAVFYDAALSAAEIMDLYRSRYPKRRANLQIHLPIFNGTAARVLDYSGNANNFNNNNAPTDGTSAPGVGWGTGRTRVILPATTGGTPITADGLTQCTGSAVMGITYNLTANGLTQCNGAAALAGSLSAAGLTQCVGTANMGMTVNMTASGLTQCTGGADPKLLASLTADGLTRSFGFASVTGSSPGVSSSSVSSWRKNRRGRS